MYEAYKELFTFYTKSCNRELDLMKFIRESSSEKQSDKPTIFPIQINKNK